MNGSKQAQAQVIKHQARIPANPEVGDQRFREAIDIWIIQSMTERRGKRPRYYQVWNDGYMAALEDVRAGRLVLSGGHFKGNVMAGRDK